MSNVIGLDVVFNEVKRFHTVFGHPVNEKPTLMNAKRVRARIDYIQEELQEFADAKDVVAQVDANLDALYFILGNFVELGVTPQALFEIVQSANMAKLFPDGKPRYDASRNNKIIKPDGWETPEPKLLAEMQRQMAV
jgi:predicted HAD superfamily Cof-like phosphohydrolase